ncbi:MAG: DUF4238 domain-containing protein [Acidovorax sp.]|nr:DUF4238 domain-containing protein [Acidovorax sp.]
MQQTKRHHYVPKAYLKAFCGPTGRLLVYRKDQPEKALPVTPDATQFRGYYYSQPLPQGGQDNNTIEAFFSTVEAKWPPAVAALHSRSVVDVALMTDIFEFMALQFARVPAQRDMVEASLAQMVKSELQVLRLNGSLPKLPFDIEGILDHVVVSIDPHQSIHAMVPIMQSMGELFNHIGLEVIHNSTCTAFLTSDNPVIWFDSSLPFAKQRPYTVDLKDGDIQFFFPVSPTMAIRGSREKQATCAKQGLHHTDVLDENWVKTINKQICRFAYEAVIACGPGQEQVIQELAELSPIHEAITIPGLSGFTTLHRQAFGARAPKPKWKTSES